MKLQKLAGATSEIWQIFIADSSSTTGAGLPGLVFNSGSLTAYYHRDTDTTATAITLVTMTVGTFTSSGFKEIDATNMPGWYQLCPPNAALASGAKSVGIHLKGATNMAPLPIEVQLTAVNPDSATAFMTSVATVTTVTNQLTAAQIATGVWQDATGGDFTTASSIGKSLYTSGVVPGGSGGILISGSNSGTTTLGALTVTGATTHTGNVSMAAGLNITQSSSNTSALVVTGNGTGHGAILTSGSGATGDGFKVVSAATNGNGMTFVHAGTGKDLNATTYALTIPGDTWDVTLASHVTAGSTGFALNAAGAAGDPWSTSIPGAYAAGSAGYIVGTILNATDSGTAQSVTGTTLVMKSAAAFADSELVGQTLHILAATTGAGQSRLITANVGSTDTLTVDTWTTTPTGTITYAIYPSAPGSATSPAQVNVLQWNSTNVSSPATAGVPDVNIKNINNVTASGVTTVSANQGTTQPINFTSTAGNALVKSDMVDVAGSAVSTSSAQLGVNVVQAGATAWNSGSITTATLAATTGLIPIRSSTAQSGSTNTTIKLDASASATDNFYNNTLILLTGGTGANQSRFVTAYVGATKVATVAQWVTTPDNTTTFAILPFDAVAGATAPTAAQVATAVWQDTTSSDFTTSSSIGKSLFTGVAPGAASGVAIVGSNMGTVTSVTNPATISTGVWQDATAGDFTTAGSIGKSLFTSGNAPGAASGIAIVGSNMGSTTSVTSPVTVGTNNDKTGYSLSTSAGIKKNTALAGFPFLMTDSTNHNPVSGLTVTAERSLDGAAFGTCTNAVSQTSNGWYKIDLSAGDLNGNTVALKFTATGADQLDIGIITGA